jgi:Domain of unknown function (DUF5664)
MRLVTMTSDNAQNPKAALGAAKTPLGLIPSNSLVEMAEVFQLGAAKYGPYNWRETAVNADTYVNAAYRHIASWFDREDHDPESGRLHLAHAMACMAILIDAYHVGKLVDNRPPSGNVAGLIRAYTRKVDPSGPTQT